MCDAVCCAIKCAAPLTEWRTIKASTNIASKLRIVSSKLSPFEVADVAIFILITSAPNFFAANSKVVRVRVLFSKNKFITVLSRNNGIDFIFLDDCVLSINVSAVSRICVKSSALKPSGVKKCLSFPSTVNCKFVVIFLI